MRKKILERIEKGLTYKQIQKELGCALSTISYHCKMMGVESQHLCNKIDAELIRKIRETYTEVKSSSKVAKMFNVSKTTVLKYVDVIRTTKMSSDSLKANRVKSVIDWRKRKKIELVEYKGGKCEKCGYSKCIDALDFHHVDPNEKDFTIGGKSWSFDRLKNEVDKCILVCANCHREIHSEIKTAHTEPH